MDHLEVYLLLDQEKCANASKSKKYEHANLFLDLLRKSTVFMVQLWRRQLLSFVLHDHHDLIMLFNPFGNVPSKFTS